MSHSGFDFPVKETLWKENHKWICLSTTGQGAECILSVNLVKLDPSKNWWYNEQNFIIIRALMTSIYKIINLPFTKWKGL